MATFALTGKVGAGKSLVAVHKIHEAFTRGMKVATNLDINMEFLCGPKHAQHLVRLPDHPSRHDLDAIGDGCDSPDEEGFGYLVIDEAATFLNSRNWQGEGRERVVEWFRHVRKHGWHLYLIIQDISSLDKQIREAIIEHLVICRRSDRMPIPIIGWLLKLFGFTGKWAKFHIGIVKYGLNSNSLTVDRWWYRGTHFYAAYDTRQIFDGNRDKGKMMHSLLDVKRAPWLQEPKGFYESIYLSGQDIAERWPQLSAFVPRASAARGRWLEFTIADKGFFPKKQNPPHAYARWASAQISAAESTLDGVHHAASNDTFEPLYEAAE